MARRACGGAEGIENAFLDLRVGFVGGQGREEVSDQWGIVAFKGKG